MFEFEEKVEMEFRGKERQDPDDRWQSYVMEVGQDDRTRINTVVNTILTQKFLYHQPNLTLDKNKNRRTIFYISRQLPIRTRSIGKRTAGQLRLSWHYYLANEESTVLTISSSKPCLCSLGEWLLKFERIQGNIIAPVKQARVPTSNPI
jgi:hypothetical protein